MVRLYKEDSFEAELISSGRVTIPSFLRKKYGLKKGDRASLKIYKEEEEGSEIA